MNPLHKALALWRDVSERGGPSFLLSELLPPTKPPVRNHKTTPPLPLQYTHTHTHEPGGTMAGKGTAAKKAISAAKNIDLKKMAKTVKEAKTLADEVAPVITPIYEKYAPAAKDAAQKAGQTVTDKARELSGNVEAARDGLAKAIGDAGDQLNQMKLTKEQEKQAKKEKDRRRRAVISEAQKAISAKEFIEHYEMNVELSEDGTSTYSAFPGCYVILLMKSAKAKDNLDYEKVFVWCSKNVGADIYRQLQGYGNVDVYADYKYEMPQRILTYPCKEEAMATRAAQIMEDLDALDKQKSYNWRDAFDLMEFPEEDEE